jgi:hypothetical protein
LIEELTDDLDNLTVLVFRTDGHAEPAVAAVFGRLWSEDDAFFLGESDHLLAFLAGFPTVEEDVVGVGGEVCQSGDISQGILDVFDLVVIESHPLLEGLGILEGSQGSPHGDGADIPGEQSGGDLTDDVFVAQGVTEAQAGQTVSFGEGAGDDDVGILAGEGNLGLTQPGEFDVSFVNDEGDAGLGDGDEVLGFHEVAGGVIGVGDDDDLGLVGDGLQDGPGVEQELAVLVDHGDGDQVAAEDVAAQFVDAEARGVLDDFLAGLQEAAENVIEDFTGTVTDHDVFGAVEAIDVGDLGAHDQTLVRVAVSQFAVRLDGFLHHGRRFDRVLVGHHAMQFGLAPGEFDVRRDVHLDPLDPWDVILIDWFHSFSPGYIYFFDWYLLFCFSITSQHVDPITNNFVNGIFYHGIDLARIIFFSVLVDITISLVNQSVL